MTAVHHSFAERIHDYCLILNTPDGDEVSDVAKRWYDKLSECGFSFDVYQRADWEKHTYILFSAPIDNLRAFANHIDFNMLLDSSALEKAANLKNLNIADASYGNSKFKLTRYGPFDRIYGPYRRDVEHLYHCPDGCSHPFGESARLKLIKLILNNYDIDKETIHDTVKDTWDSYDVGYCFSAPKIGKASGYISLTEDLDSGDVVALFSLHNDHTVKDLSESWAWYPFTPHALNPFDTAAEYFGEKIGLFFQFLDHTTKYLIVPGAFGLALQVATYVVRRRRPGTVHT